MRHKLLFPFFIFLIVALPICSKDFVLTSGQTVVIACALLKNWLYEPHWKCWGVIFRQYCRRLPKRMRKQVKL